MFGGLLSEGCFGTPAVSREPKLWWLQLRWGTNVPEPCWKAGRAAPCTCGGATPVNATLNSKSTCVAPTRGHCIVEQAAKVADQIRRVTITPSAVASATPWRRRCHLERASLLPGHLDVPCRRGLPQHQSITLDALTFAALAVHWSRGTTKCNPCRLRLRLVCYRTLWPFARLPSPWRRREAC